MLDLPEPVCPTSAKVSPGRMRRLKSFQHLLAFVVVEIHVDEFNLALELIHRVIGFLLDQGFGVNQGEDALASSQAQLKLAPEKTRCWSAGTRSCPCPE